jgi:hypothetical protein
MSAPDSVTPTRLLVVLATGEDHRLVAEVRTDTNGAHRTAISCWKDTAEGPRQQGQSVEVASASKLTALADAVNRAIADHRRR